MNSPKKIILLLLTVQFYVFFAQCPYLFGQYHFDSWTTDNGLPQNGIRAITQTPDGYLWFTTFDGLVRFDGVRFTTFSKSNTKGIINNRFTSIYSDKDGTVYASTTEDGVLTVYRNGVFTSYTSEQVPGNYIRIIRPDETGEVRFLVQNEDLKSDSWYFLRDGEFVFSERIEKNAKTKYRGRSGTLWTLEAGKITELRNGTSTVYNYKIERLESFREAFEDSEGALWIGGVELLRLKDGAVQVFGEKDVFPVNSGFQIFWEESDGSVWFANGGTSAAGVGLVSYKNGAFSHFGTEVGLSNASIFDIFKDREGTIWLATSKGLNRLRKDVITAYSTKDGLRNSEIYPLYRDRRDNIWIGTAKGLSIYRNGQFEDVKLQQARQDVPEYTKWKNDETSVQSIFEDENGKMWIGVNGGIFIAENGHAEMLPESEGYHVYSIQQDRGGNVWAATNRGILRFNDYKLSYFYTPKDGLPNEFMTVIHEDSQGNLWFGGLGGLSQFKNGKFINYTSKEGLTGNYVRSIYEDAEGTLWIGTYDEGLSRFKDGHFVNYNTENGLSNNGVFAIEEDARGNFWISSNVGIYRVKRQELNDFADRKIAKIHSVGYGKEDGMLNSECNGGRQPASLRNADGKFWFPTQDGIVVIDPESETQNVLPPFVVIESATVEREKVGIGEGLRIEPGQKNIEINFTGISLIKSEQIRFKYKLEGHDADWVDADMRRTAYYSYLPPGNYKFRVIAANSDGVWNEEGAALNVKLKPFFYQTKTFVLGSLAAGALCLFLVWQFSVFQLKAHQKKLAKLISEKTEELREANGVLQHLANSDGLTAVGNRRRFEEFLAEEWNRAIRYKSEISLILIDIDHFKLFNDTYGHQAGDECLKEVAKALQNAVHRTTDLVARFGGEEFAIVLGGTDAEGAFNIADLAMKNLEKLKISHCKSLTHDFLTISVGIATTFVHIGMLETELIKAADKALYQAKENGRNRIFSSDFAGTVPKSSVLVEEYVGVS